MYRTIWETESRDAISISKLSTAVDRNWIVDGKYSLYIINITAMLAYMPIYNKIYTYCYCCCTTHVARNNNNVYINIRYNMAFALRPECPSATHTPLYYIPFYIHYVIIASLYTLYSVFHILSNTKIFLQKTLNLNNSVKENVVAGMGNTHSGYVSKSKCFNDYCTNKYKMR